MRAERPRVPCAVIVFGVAGVGKTSVTRRLAEQMSAALADADDYHDPRRIAQMRAGVPLEDADRWEWLRRLRALIDESLARDKSIVLACSALKASYRDILCGHDSDTILVELELRRETLEERIAVRTGHFMPASMLDSQLSSFEPLTDLERDRGSFAVSAEPEVDAIANEILARLAARLPA